MSEALATSAGTPIWVDGTGPPLVLIHGVLMDHRMWERQVANLANDFRVICLDMLGHGEAPDPPGPRTLDDFVEQVHEVLQCVCGEERAVLLGFSMGGLIAQAYGIRYGRSLRGLILMSAVYDRSPAERDTVMARLANLEGEGIEGVVSLALQRWFREDERRDYPLEIDEIVAWLRAGDADAKTKAYRVFATSDSQTAGRIHEIACPTLVMTGDGDAGSPPHMSQAMAAQIPDARLRILPRQQHMMAVLDAENVSDEIRDFVNSLPG